jgi:5-methylcytosine-specific restriction endonuclease McrA
VPPRRHARGRGGRPYRRLAARLRQEQQVCWLCGLPIDGSLRRPHPGSWSMDHVIPVSMGGELIDPLNVRAAHLGCNMRRGNGRGSPKTPGDRSASW